MMEHFKTILLVTLIAALVWVFAESESLTSRKVKAEILFEVEPDSARIIDLPDNATGRERVDVVIEGSTGAVSEAEAMLGRLVRLRPGMEGVSAEPGERVVNLRTAIANWPDLRELGVTVVRVDPESVRVKVDQIVDREIKVVVEAPDVLLDGAPEMRPSTAKLVMPQSAAAMLTAESVARARVSPESLARLVPGRRETVANVPLSPPAEIAGIRGVRIEPARAEVQLTIRSKDSAIVLPSVPVQVKLAGSEAGRWEITIPEDDKFLTDVEVRGPSEMIDRIKAGELTVTAFVSLSFEDLERGITSKDAVFSELPTPLTFKAGNTKVRLTIKRREPVATPPESVGSFGPRPR